MTDATLTTFDSNVEHSGAQPDNRPIHPATRRELPVIHARLMEAIETSPYYCDEFKAYEMARLSEPFLRSLWSIDPRHVMAVHHNGKLAGFMISSPELGTLWHYWNYMFPENSDPLLPMRCMRAFVETWDNDRFHKIAAYSRPENRVSIALMKRYKYRQVALLKNQLFGEDYVLFERPLNKVIPGYDHGINIGLPTRLKNRVLYLLGL